MKKHSKRYQAPTKKWGLPAKRHFWAPKTRPGAHKVERSVPLLVVVRDFLGYAESAREAKRIINGRKILIDGNIKTDENSPVGLMDVVSIPDLKEHYRVMFDQSGKIRIMHLTEGNQGWKLCRIENKTSLKDGKTQYNLHDGRNLVMDDAKAYNTKDVLKLELPSQLVMDSYEFKEGNIALVTGGKHIGEIGHIERYEVVKSSKPNLVHLEGGISTIEDFVFVLGKDKPVIEIPEVGIV